MTHRAPFVSHRAKERTGNGNATPHGSSLSSGHWNCLDQAIIAANTLFNADHLSINYSKVMKLYNNREK